jgi:8-oxo-dGTP pyrophosphatase MutT (NUDIX family)
MDLPYRDRVEVVIQKDDKILVTKNKDKESGKEWFGFPGGGLDGQKAVEACQNESLEEVGVRIKNIKPLDLEFTEEGGMSKKDNRHLKYRGSITKWYSADFDEMDRSKLGEDNDSRKYAWKTHQEALQAVKGGRDISTQRQAAIKALKPVKSVLEKSASKILNYILTTFIEVV